jgi:TorA maturation chaperone TorD
MEMREAGVEQAIRAAGGVGASARGFGVSRAAVSNRQQVFPDPILSPAAPTGVHRTMLRPDLHAMSVADQPELEVDEVDLLRSHEYGLLAVLFGRAPTADVLARLSQLKGDASLLGIAHVHLAHTASTMNVDAISREFFDMFIGVGRGELLPYGSYYLTGFLHERPLARVRQDLIELGIERVEEQREPEDHIAILCEVMSGLTSGRFGAEPGADRRFFEKHLKPWAGRFFADCETSKRAEFYKVAGAVGRLFMEIEAEAFAMDA